MRLSLNAFRARPGRVMILACVTIAAGLIGWLWDDLFEKRVVVVEPGRLIRGSWQRPGPLRRIIAREGIRTIVSLTAINEDDPKYVDQARVVRETGVRWIFVPMRGSRATAEQMAEAADLLADPGLQPVFFHCVAGHHRTSLVHAAYRIRHDGWDAQRAWNEVAGFAWARPASDLEDRRLIEAFARTVPGRVGHDATRSTPEAAASPLPLDPHADPGDRRVELRDGELRAGRGGAVLSVGADAGLGARPDGS